MFDSPLKVKDMRKKTSMVTDETKNKVYYESTGKVKNACSHPERSMSVAFNCLRRAAF